MRPIDADALKTHVCDMCDDGQRECKGDESCAILCWINDMPTIEAEPVRHGRWIKQENGMNVCSACEAKRVSRFNFCGNCGAKMDADHIADASKKVGGADNA